MIYFDHRMYTNFSGPSIISKIILDSGGLNEYVLFYYRYTGKHFYKHLVNGTTVLLHNVKTGVILINIERE